MDSSTGYMVCELKVDTQSPGWQKTLTKLLSGITGVSFTIDAERGIARVSGKIDPNKLLLTMAKAKKHAELLWVDSGKHYRNMEFQDGSSYHGHMRLLHGSSYGCHSSDYLYSGGGGVPYQPSPFYYPDHQYNYHGHDPYYSYYNEQLPRYFSQAPVQDPSCNIM